MLYISCILQLNMMSGSKAPDFDAYGLFRATHSHVSAPLRSVLNMCHWHMFSTPVFAYRSQNVKLTKIKARTYRLQQFTVSLMILAFSLNKLF